MPPLIHLFMEIMRVVIKMFPLHSFWLEFIYTIKCFGVTSICHFFVAMTNHQEQNNLEKEEFIFASWKHHVTQGHGRVAGGGSWLRQEWSRNYTRLKSLKGFFWWLTSYSKVLFPKGSIASPKHYHHLETKWHLQIITCNWRLQDIKTSGNVWSFWQITENFENSWTDGKPLQLLIFICRGGGVLSYPWAVSVKELMFPSHLLSKYRHCTHTTSTMSLALQIC